MSSLSVVVVQACGLWRNAGLPGPDVQRHAVAGAGREGVVARLVRRNAERGVRGRGARDDIGTAGGLPGGGVRHRVDRGEEAVDDDLPGALGELPVAAAVDADRVRPRVRPLPLDAADEADRVALVTSPGVEEKRIDGDRETACGDGDVAQDVRQERVVRSAEQQIPERTGTAVRRRSLGDVLEFAEQACAVAQVDVAHDVDGDSLAGQDDVVAFVPDGAERVAAEPLEVAGDQPVAYRAVGPVGSDVPAAAREAEGRAGERGVVPGEGVQAVRHAVAVEVDVRFRIEAAARERVAGNDVAVPRGDREGPAGQDRPLRRVGGALDQRQLGRGEVRGSPEGVGEVGCERLPGGDRQSVVEQASAPVVVVARETGRGGTDVAALESQSGVHPVPCGADRVSIRTVADLQPVVVPQVHGGRDVGAAVEEVAAPDGGDGGLLAVAVLRQAVVDVDFEPLVVVAQDEVDDAGDCIGAVDGRGAARQHIDPFDQRHRHRADVDRGGAVQATDVAAAVDQHERSFGPESAQAENARAVAEARTDGLLGRHRLQQRRNVVDHVRHRELARCADLGGGDRFDRQRMGVIARDPGTRDDDFLDGRTVQRGAGLSERRETG